MIFDKFAGTMAALAAIDQIDREHPGFAAAKSAIWAKAHEIADRIFDGSDADPYTQADYTMACYLASGDCTNPRYDEASAQFMRLARIQFEQAFLGAVLERQETGSADFEDASDAAAAGVTVH